MLSTGRLWSTLQASVPDAQNNLTLMKTDALKNGAFQGTNLDRQWNWEPASMKRAVLVGLSDMPFDLKLLLQHSAAQQPRIWMVQNNDVPTNGPSTVVSVPIGLTNDCHDSPVHPILGNTALLRRAFSEYMKKREAPQLRPLCYAGFSVSAWPSERRRLMNHLLSFSSLSTSSWLTLEDFDKPLQNEKEKESEKKEEEGGGNLSPEEAERLRFLKKLARHQFVVTPRAEGLDTHLIWESIYMGAVPIVKYHAATHEQWRRDGLPILFVDDWSELSLGLLRSARAQSALRRLYDGQGIQKCTVRYWATKLAAAIAGDAVNNKK
jgi:hypothetical protein